MNSSRTAWAILALGIFAALIPPLCRAQSTSPTDSKRSKAATPEASSSWKPLGSFSGASSASSWGVKQSGPESQSQTGGVWHDTGSETGTSTKGRARLHTESQGKPENKVDASIQSRPLQAKVGNTRSTALASTQHSALSSPLQHSGIPKRPGGIAAHSSSSSLHTGNIQSRLGSKSKKSTEKSSLSSTFGVQVDKPSTSLGLGPRTIKHDTIDTGSTIKDSSKLPY